VLDFYRRLTQALLQAPSSPVPLISQAAIDEYINLARTQTAAEGECIRAPALLSLAVGVPNYRFFDISAGATSIAGGVGGVIAIRSGRIGARRLDIRPWEWFANYYLTSAAIGPPLHVGQQGQGLKGTLFFSPIPDTAVAAEFDAVCLPQPLFDDFTPEALPEIWIYAVPFYAAWLAFQSVQRQSDADAMFRRYKEMVMRARQGATPSQMPDNLPGGQGTKIAASHSPIMATPQPAGGGR
jgi:hypothetical protein